MCRAMPTANTRAFNAHSPGRRICNVSNRTEDDSPRPEFLSLIPEGVGEVGEGPKLYPIVGRHFDTPGDRSSCQFATLLQYGQRSGTTAATST